jgi:anti-anti-sigma regulatory factor
MGGLPARFDASVEYVSSGTLVRLSGTLDEEKDLGDLARQIPAGRVFVDLGEITRMNSLGLRKWIYWIQEIEGRGAQPVLVRCSRPVVLQLNQIHNFAGTRGIVASFQLPYFCSRCQREQSMIVTPGDLNGPPWEAPDFRCENCDHLMEFDDVPEAYFDFLGRMRPEQKAAPGFAAGLVGLGGAPSTPRIGGGDLTGPTKVLGGSGELPGSMAAGTPTTSPGQPGRPSEELLAQLIGRAPERPPLVAAAPPPAIAPPPPLTPSAAPPQPARSRGAAPVVPTSRLWLVVLIAAAVVSAGILAWGLLA